MSVEEDSRQEWTFTLYDFDNNGKVTREVSARGRHGAIGHASNTPAPSPSPKAGPAPTGSLTGSGGAWGGEQGRWSFRETWRNVPELPGEWAEVTGRGGRLPGTQARRCSH